MKNKLTFFPFPFSSYSILIILRPHVSHLLRTSGRCLICQSKVLSFLLEPFTHPVISHMQNRQSHKEEQNGENQGQSHAIKDMRFSEQLIIKGLHSLCLHELLSAAFGPKVGNLVLETAAVVEAVERFGADLLRGREIDRLNVENGLTCAALQTASESNQPGALIRAQNLLVHPIRTQLAHLKVRRHHLLLLLSHHVIQLETRESALVGREVVRRDELVFEVDDGIVAVHALELVPVDARLDHLELSLELGIFLETFRHEEYIVVNLILERSSVPNPHLRCHNSLLHLSPLTLLFVLPHKKTRMDLHANI